MPTIKKKLAGSVASQLTCSRHGRGTVVDAAVLLTQVEPGAGAWRGRPSLPDPLVLYLSLLLFRSKKISSRVCCIGYRIVLVWNIA